MCTNTALAERKLVDAFTGSTTFELDVYERLRRSVVKMSDDRKHDAAHEMYLRWLARPRTETYDAGAYAHHLAKDTVRALRGSTCKSLFGPMIGPPVMDVRQWREEDSITALDVLYSMDRAPEWRQALAKLERDGWTIVEIAAEMGVSLVKARGWFRGWHPAIHEQALVDLARNPPAERYQGTEAQFIASTHKRRRDPFESEPPGAPWHEALKEMVANGWTIAALSGRLGYQRSDVSKWVSRHQTPHEDSQANILVMLRLCREGKLSPPREHHRIDVAEALSMRASGSSIKQVAARFKVTPKAVSQALSRASKRTAP